MLRGARSSRPAGLRQLLIDEVARRKTLSPETYFTPNWRLEPSGGWFGIPRRHSSPTERAGGPVWRDGAGRLQSVDRIHAVARASGRTLRIIATNDFHGSFELGQTAPALGAAAPPVTGVIARARAECAAGSACVSVLVDGGDMFQTVRSQSHSVRPSSTCTTRWLLGSGTRQSRVSWGRDSLRAPDASGAISGAGSQRPVRRWARRRRIPDDPAARRLGEGGRDRHITVERHGPRWR